MNVVLISQGASLAAPPILAQTAARVVGLVESAPRSYDPNAVRRQGILRSFREGLRRPRTLPQLARWHRIPYFIYHSGNTLDLAEWLCDLQVDLIVVQSMSQLLPDEILAIPPLGILNLHPSLLPAYRGPNPWFWVFRNDEAETGVTLHYVDAGEDTGDIVFQERIAIERGARLPDLLEKAIGEIGAGMICRALRTLAAGDRLPRQSQPIESPTARARNVSRTEFKGHINWNEWAIERIWHFLRGNESCLPFLGQPARKKAGVTMRVGGIERPSKELPPPGSFGVDESGSFVSCRDGKIRVTEEFSLARWARNALGGRSMRQSP